MATKPQISNSYWPEFYDDELLYSAIARFKRYAQIPSSEKINEYLFGWHKAEIVVDLPEQLGYLSSVLPLRRNLTADYIMKNHTLYNYYAAFADDGERSELSDWMISSRRKVRSAKVRRMSAVGVVDHLRFCPDCVSEMIEKYGEAYWKREHQLPTVRVCVVHNKFLSVSSVVSSSKAREYIAFDKNITGNGADSAQCLLSDIGFQQLRRIAQASADCLRYASQYTSCDLNVTYRRELHNKGLANNIAKVNMVALEKEANEYAKTLLPIWPKIITFNNDSERWFKIPIRKRGCKIHPAYHLLFQDFVRQIPAASFHSSNRNFWKNIDADWPCYNPLLQDHENSVVKIIGTKNVPGGVRVRFECNCGYSYNKFRKYDGSFGPPRLTSYGPTLIPLLAQAKDEGWSMNKLSKSAGIAYGVVITQAKKLGVPIEQPPTRKKTQP